MAHSIVARPGADRRERLLPDFRLAGAVADRGVAHDFKVKVGHSALLHLVGTGVSGLAGLVVIVFVSRRLGYDDLGLYSLGLGVALLTSVVTRLGLDYSAVHFISKHTGRGEPAQGAASARFSLLMSAAAGALGAAAIWLAAPRLSQFLQEPGFEPVLVAFAPLVPLYNAFYVAVAALRGAQRIPLYVGLRFLLLPVLTMVFVASAVLARPSLMLAVHMTWAAALVALAVTVVPFSRTFSGHGRHENRQAVLRFGGWSLLIQFLHFTILWIDLAIVGYFLAPQDVGVYRVAAQTALLFSLVVFAFEALYAPLGSALVAAGERRHLNEVTTSTARLCFVLTGAGGLFATLSPDTFLAPFGPHTGPVLVPFVLLTMAHTLSSAMGPSNSLVLMAGRPGIEAVTTLPALLLSVGLAAWLVPRYGVPGAALATSVALILRNLNRLYFLRSIFRVSPVSPQLLVGLAFFAAILAGAAAVVHVGDGYQIAVAAASTFSFVGVCFLFVITAQDRDVLKAIFARLFKWRPPP